MANLAKLSAKRKRQAGKLLAEGEFLKTLARYGTPEIIGSYALDVMYDPDIDIVVRTGNPRKSSLDALRDFLAQRKFQKYEYGDFVRFRRAGRPQGFIVNLHATQAGTKWEIEIWFLKSISKELTLNAFLMQAIDAKKRAQIVRLKHERAKKGKSKHEQSSMDLYRKVIKGIP